MKLNQILSVGVCTFSLINALAQECAPPPDGLVSWWTLDGAIRDGISANHPSAVNAVTFPAGQVGLGLALGAGGFVEIPAAANLNLSQFTLEAWAKPMGPGPNNDQLGSVIIEKAISGTVGYGLLWRGSDSKFVFMSGDINQIIVSSNAFPAGAFYHVAGVYTGGSYDLYVNGKLEGSRSLPAPDLSTSSPWSIGSTDARFRATFPRTFNGVIDEVAIFNRALSQSEIAAIHNAASAGKCRSCLPPPANLVSWFGANGSARDTLTTNQGVLQGGANYVTGLVDRAFNFDGVNDYAGFGDVLDPGAGSFSVEGWIRIADATNSYQIVSKGVTDLSSPPNAGYAISGNETNLNFVVHDGGSLVTVSVPLPGLDQFHHLAAVLDRPSSKIQLFINGVLAGERSFGALGPIDTEIELSFGAMSRAPRGSATNFFKGQLDEISFYNRALTAGEIFAVSNAGENGKCIVPADVPNDIAAGNTLLIQGSVANGHLTLVRDGFKNFGTVRFESINDQYTSAIRLTNGVFTNMVGGVVEINQGSRGPRTINGDFQNFGLLKVNHPLSFNTPSGRYDNEGQIQITGASINLSGQNQIFSQHSGAILMTNSSMDLEGATFNYQGGSIVGTPYLVNSVLYIGPKAFEPAAFTMTGSASRFWGNILPGHTVWFQGNARGNHSTIIAPEGFSNSGIIRMESINDAYTSSFTVSNGTLTNNQGGRIEINPGAGGPRILSTHLLNLGDVHINFGAEFRRAGGVYNNAGNLNVAAGRTLSISGSSQVFNQTGGNLNLGGTLDLESITFNYLGGKPTGSPPYLVNSTLNLGPAALEPASFTLTGNGSRLNGNVKPGQTIWFQGSGRGGHSTIISSNGFSNSGVLKMESINDQYTSSFTVSNGVLTNNSGGRLDINQGAAGPRVLSTHLLNLGEVNVRWPSQFIRAGGQYNNAGTLNISPGITLWISGNSQVFNQTAGNLNISGALDLDSMTFQYLGGKATGAPPYLVNTFLNLGPAALEPASFTLTGSGSRLNGDVKAGQTVWIQGSGRGGHTTVIATNGFVNHGALQLRSINDQYSSSFTVSNGAITNAATGKIQIQPGAIGPRNLTADILNRGFFEVDWNATLAKSAANYINDGTWTIKAGRTLNINNIGRFLQRNGSLNVDGALALTGDTFDCAGGQINVTGAFDIQGMVLNYSGGQIVGGPYMVNSVLNMAANIGEPIQFTMTGSSSRWNGNLAAGQSLWIQGSGRGGHTTVISSNGFSNAGSIRMESINDQYASSFTILSGGLTNDTSGSIQINRGAAGSRTFSGHLVNRGAVGINWPTTFSRAAGLYENLGQFIIAPGITLTIHDNSQRFDQLAGKLQIDGALDLQGVNFNYMDGTIAGVPYMVNCGLQIGPQALQPASFTLTGSGTRLWGNVHAGHTLWLQGSGRGGHTTIIATNGFLNSGTLRLESINDQYTTALTIQTGVLHNASVGRILINEGARGPRILSAHLLNEGALLGNWHLTLSKSGGLYENEGEFRMAPGRVLSIDGAGQSFRQNNGVLATPGSTEFLNMRFDYDGGVIEGPTYLLNSTLNIRSGGPGDFTVSGSSTRFNGNLAAGQKLWIQGSGRGAHTTIVSSNGFSNSGSIRFESINDQYTSSLNVLSGTVTNEAGGTIDFNVGARGPRHLTADVLNLGTFNVNWSAALNKANGAMVNEGTLTVQSGQTLSLSGSYAQNRGVTRLNGGTLDPAGLIELDGGAIEGTGTIAADLANSSRVSAGLPNGVLTVSGNYTQDVSGVLELELFSVGTTNVTIESDRLSVSGTAQLAGTLAVRLSGPVTLTNGFTATVLSAGRIAGRFDQYDLPTLPPSQVWDLGYGGQSVVLRILSNTNSVLKISGVVTNTAGQPLAGVTVAGLLEEATFAGLRGDYYDNADFTSLKFSRLDGPVDFDWGGGSPDPGVAADTFSVRWSGFVTPLFTETYTFYTVSDDGVRLWVNGQQLINNWGDHGPTENSGTISLTNGTRYDLLMEYYENGGGATAMLSWSSASQTKQAIPGSFLVPSSITNVNPTGILAIVATATTDSNGRYELLIRNGNWVVGVHGLETLGYNPVTNQTVIVNNANATANFAARPFSGQLHNLTLESNPPEAGVLTGAGRFPQGANVTVEARPNTQTRPWLFASWTENGLLQSASNRYSFSLTRDRNLRANFVLPQFDVAVSNSPAGAGTVTGTGRFVWGTTNVLQARPSFGYRFDRWLDETGQTIATDPRLTLVVTSQRSLTAVYADANLFHDVSTATLPAGLALVTGAGRYTNGQTATIAAPSSVTNASMVFTFKRFLLNGAALAGSNVVQKTFSTLDVTNLNYTAEYEGRSLFPVIARAISSFENPIPRTTNLVLTFIFDRSMRSNEPRIVITNTVTTGAGLNISTGGVWKTTTVSNDTYSTAPIVIAAGQDGTYLVNVSQAADLTGAQLAATNALSLVVDATLPITGNIAITPDVLSARITWITDEPATAQVEYGTSPALGSITPLLARLATDHSILISGLSPNTTYLYRLLNRDRAGNLSSSAVAAFTTLRDTAAPDTRLVSGPGGAVRACSLPVTFEWAGTDDVTAAGNLLFAYRIDGGARTAFAKTNRVEFSNLTEGSHRLEVFARDEAGNEETSPAAADFIFDVRPPALSAINSAPAQARAVISWTTDEPATGQVEYGTNATLSLATGLDARFTTNHSFVLSGLTPNTAYQFRVKSKDPCGVEMASSILTFQTLPAPDLHVTNLVTTPSSNLMSGASVEISWGDANNGLSAAAGPWFDLVVASNLTTGQKLFERIFAVGGLAEGPLAIGATKTRRQTFQLPDGTNGAGAISILVSVDFHNNELEQNSSGTAESNNSRILSFTSALAPYPELQVTNLVISSNLVSGGEVTVSWEEWNVGNLAVNESFQTRLLVRNLGSAEVLLNTLLPYEVLDVTLKSPIPPGEKRPRSYRFHLPEGARGSGVLQAEVTTDALNDIFEHNANGLGEANNTAVLRATARLAEYPDIVVSSITAPASGVGGQSLSISWTLQNRGAAAVNGTWFDQVFLSSDNVLGSDELIGNFLFTGVIPPGETIERTGQITLPVFGSGNRWLVVRGDAGNHIFENDDGNNAFIDDQPIGLAATLSIALNKQSINESPESGLLTATITRNTDRSQPQIVILQNSNPAQAAIAGSATIPAGEASVRLEVRSVDDDVVDGSQRVEIVAAAPGFQSGGAEFTVTDNDTPTLTIDLSKASVLENAGNGAASGMITRNTSTNEPLTVNLRSSDTSKITVPASVTIPAGQRAGVFAVNAVNNQVPNAPATITIGSSLAGFQVRAATLTIVDDDAPTLSLRLAETSVSEGAQNPATELTITRSPALEPVTVVLRSSDLSAAQVPLFVPFPSNVVSVTVPVTVVNDELVDSAQQTVLSAFATDALLETVIESSSGSATLTVTDDDGPTLKLRFAAELLSESGAVLATVTRNTPATNALIVNLRSEDATEAATPASVTIPIGASSATFNVTGVADGVGDGIQRVIIVASANGYTSAQAGLNVTDIDLPDLQPFFTNLVATALGASKINVSWIVKNSGVSTADGPWVDRLYISSAASGASPQLVAEILRVEDLPVGASYERTAQVTVPGSPGEYYFVLIADESNRVREGSERNNRILTPTALEAQPAYRATVQADLDAVIAGTPMPLRGRAIRAGTADPAAFAEVTVRILLKGTRRVFKVTTDAAGNFTTFFRPLPTEAGLCQVAADHPGVTQDTLQDEFTIHGMRFREGEINYRLYPETEQTGQVTLQNLGDTPLTGVSVVPEGLPATVRLAYAVTNFLAPGAQFPISYSIASSNIVSDLQIQARLKATSAEGVVTYLPVILYLTTHKPNLVANPGYLRSGMTRGQKKLIEFTVSNTGGAASGPVRVMLPDVPWMSLVSSVELESLASGDSSRVILALDPAADLPLTQYNGELILAAQLSRVSLPFQFRALSEARGDLRVEVNDDYTFYAAGAPKVAGATVTLFDPLSNTTVAEGVTGTNGVLVLTNIFEGMYQLTVSAAKHNTYRNPVKIEPGITNEVTAFIDRQTVSYRWTVVPTEVQDHYRVVLESVFETEVPVPVVTIDNPLLLAMVVRGEETQVDIQVTNHGLIAAEKVSVEAPQHPDYIIEPLVDEIDILPAKSTRRIPVIIRARETVQFAQSLHSVLGQLQRQKTFTGCDPIPKITVKWSYVCGPDRRWRANETQIIMTPVEYDCWEEIKDVFSEEIDNIMEEGFDPKDLLKWDKLCDLGALIAKCLNDECLVTIVKMVCGVATRDVKGAIEGALRFGNCWCPSLPSLPTVNPGNPGRIDWPPPPIIDIPIGFGGGGGGPGGGPRRPWIPEILWDFSPDCRPGDTIEGEHEFSASHADHAAGQPAAGTIQPLSTRPGGVCARVRIRIEQEAVITRAAFLGTLEIDNEQATNLTGLQLTIDIRDAAQNAANNLFATRGPVLAGLTGVDGSGVLAAQSSGTAKYTFIPTRDAAPEGPTVYKIGGVLRYMEGTNVIEVPLLPDTITVFPDPVLHLKYFQQRDVFADDPFTDEVEPSEPFALGLLVQNTGKGAAIDFKITSAQPKIIENEKGLLIDFKIIGTQVGSQSVSPSLTVNLGGIETGQSKVGLWLLTSTLQGKFIEYTATFEHIDGLGDPRLSLIDSVEIHELIHAVRADREGDDDSPDFLVNDQPDPDNLPETLYLSNGGIHTVNVITSATADGAASPADLEVKLTATVGASWNYLRVPNPGPGLRLARVTRSDGKSIRVGANAWTTDRSFPASLAGARREHLLHLFDFGGPGVYTLQYRLVDKVAPAIVSVGPVEPFVQTGPISSVDVVFSETVDLSTFDHRDLVLKRNGGSNLITSSVTVVAAGQNRYTVNGLSSVTAADGNYELTVRGEGITDLAENSTTNALSVAWAKASGNAVIVKVEGIAAPLRNVPVLDATVTFSKPIDPATFTLADVRLSREGGPNLLTPPVAITAINATTFKVSGLAVLTVEQGTYELQFDATGVSDTGGAAGNGSVAVQWRMDTTGPSLAALERLPSRLRSTVVQSLDVTFDEPINLATFNHQDITLRRNGGVNLVTPEVVVQRVSDRVFRIVNFNWVVGDEGSYELMVHASGIQDLAGNAGAGVLAESWTMDTTRPAAPSRLRILPDLGASTSDGITSTQRVVFAGSVSETNVTVRVFDLSTQADLGLAVMDGTNFTKSIDFTAPGAHRLRADATDAAANVSAGGHLDVFVDLTMPTAVLQEVAPDPINQAVEAVQVTFSEQIDQQSFGVADFSLTLETLNSQTSTVNLGSARLLFVSNNSYQLTGLGGLTDQPGLYRLVLNLAGVRDLAGNAGTNIVLEEWRRRGSNTPPVLAAIADKLVGAESTLTFTNSATDIDIPANKLTFSLENTPAGASINPTNGVFTWRPTAQQAGAVYNVTIKVTDDGAPAASDSKVVRITVTDYIELAIGRGIAQAGASATASLSIFSSARVTNIQALLTLSGPELTGFTIESLVPEISNTSITPVPGPLPRYAIQLNARAGSSVQGAVNVAALRFLGATNRSSAFVYLTVTNLSARKLDGTNVATTIGKDGRIVFIAGEPLLEGQLDAAGRKLILYGNPGVGYQLQQKASVSAAVPWQNWQRIPLASLSQAIDVTQAGPALFLRAQVVAGPALDVVNTAAGAALTIYGVPGQSLGVESSADLRHWQPLTEIQLKQGFEKIGPIPRQEGAAFFRLQSTAE